jgi:hypothetical protein
LKRAVRVRDEARKGRTQLRQAQRSVARSIREHGRAVGAVKRAIASWERSTEDDQRALSISEVWGDRAGLAHDIRAAFKSADEELERVEQEADDAIKQMRRRKGAGAEGT